MPRLSAPLRRRFGDALRQSTALRELRAQLEKKIGQSDARNAATADRADALAADAADLRALVDKQGKQIAKLTTSVKELRERIRTVENGAERRELDHGRLTSQVGAAEERLGALEQWRADGALVDDGADVAPARILLDEVRREHEQLRVRMQTVGWYEERLRRVETTVAELYDGDVRHPI